MRRSRSRTRKNRSWIGYHPDDIRNKVENIASQIRRTEKMIHQERDAFAALVQQKLHFQAEVRQMLEQTLSEEQRLQEGEAEQ